MKPILILLLTAAILSSAGCAGRRRQMRQARHNDCSQKVSELDARVRALEMQLGASSP